MRRENDIVARNHFAVDRDCERMLHDLTDFHILEHQRPVAVHCFCEPDKIIRRMKECLIGKRNRCPAHHGASFEKRCIKSELDRECRVLLGFLSRVVVVQKRRAE
jgi:hypothetical protein